MNQSNNNKTTATFPRYFIVDGLPIRVVLEGDEVAGYTYDGTPYGLGKALEGREVDESEYNDAISLLNGQKQ
jgi:hypothetical protein